MRNEAMCRVVRLLFGLVVLVIPASSWAGAIPSKAHENAAPAADLEKVREVIGRQEVADALAAHGLSNAEVDQRLAELSPEELRSLAANIDQVQAAGAVPNYIWILLGIFLAVSILAVIF
jgi:hypothetical protein